MNRMGQSGDIHDADSLMAAIRVGWRPTYLFFWGHIPNGPSLGEHVLSQSWPATFSLNNQSYPTAEHYMTAEKARLFGDADTCAQIRSTTDPGRAKALGRQVRGFDDERWTEERVPIALRANTAKFGQNADLKEWLVGTNDTVLVEASPVDRIWGIGLAIDNKQTRNPERWRGLNLLGFALMKVRSCLQ
jgi:ribA/ribD-fused uncharacterized protein